MVCRKDSYQMPMAVSTYRVLIYWEYARREFVIIDQVIQN